LRANLTGISAGVGVIGVTIVTGFDARLDDAIAATCSDATVTAAVGFGLITIVTGFNIRLH
jgi:hypothetical protein